MKAKKIAAMVLSSFMAMSMVACGSASEPAANSEVAGEATEETTQMKGSVEGELTVSICDENQ